MAVPDPNEQGYINPALAIITNNNVDAPKTGRIPLATTTVTGFYATRTALNATTGQTDSDIALILN